MWTISDGNSDIFSFKHFVSDGLSTDPLGHKTAYLNNLIQNHGVIIHSAYGSSKDIAVYTNIGLKPKQIYIVGKVNSKHENSTFYRNSILF